MTEAEKNAQVSDMIAALGTRLNELREADMHSESKRSESVRQESEERNPQMAQESQRAQAAAAGSSSAGAFSRTDIADPPAHSNPGSGSAAKQATHQALETRSDYELVLGRGQIASCLFAGTVVVAIFAGGAYFAGKLSAMNCVAASNSIPQASAPLRVPSVLTPQAAASIPATSSASVTPPATAVAQSGVVPFILEDAKTPGTANKILASATVPAAQIAGPAAASAVTMSTNGKGTPLFADPQKGALYLQVGAVDKGMATVIAEGLRQHGLAAFVAPGPTDKVFRVLVGPCANQDDYKRVKNEIDSIDVSNFARQFGK